MSDIKWHMTMQTDQLSKIIIKQNMGEQVQNMQDDLWIKISDNDIKIGQWQDFNDYELIQEEYFRNFNMTHTIEKTHLPERSDNQDIQQMRHHSKNQRGTKTDKMSKLRRDRISRKGNAEINCNKIQHKHLQCLE